MNDKLKSLIKVTGISPDTVRYNKKAIANLISGDSPGPGPQPPTPSENTIVFSGDSTAIAFDSNGETIVRTITSTINGFYIPFTIVAPDWVVATNNNGELSLVTQRNGTGEARSGSVVLTQGELDGEQKEITIPVSQEAAVLPAFDFISNPYVLSDGAQDTVILDYIITNYPSIVLKPTGAAASDPKLLDPKEAKTVDIFGTSYTYFANNTNLESLEILAYLNNPKIWGGSFAGCNHISKIVIPESVTEIGDSAFRYVGSYEYEYHMYIGCDVYFLNPTPPSMGGAAFTDAILTKIYVPVGSGDAYKAALSTIPNINNIVEEADVKALVNLPKNVSYKLNAGGTYYEQVEANISYDDTLTYINE